MTAAESTDGGSAGPSERLRADDLDKGLIDQLHAATLKASDSCFEIKNLCATVLVPAGTLVSIFSEKKLDSSVFVSGFIVVVLFWLADSTAYYYQRKLRNAMAVVWARRADLCPSWRAYAPLRVPINWPRACFNESMSFYAIIVIGITMGWIAYLSGLIG